MYIRACLMTLPTVCASLWQTYLLTLFKTGVFVLGRHILNMYLYYIITK
jgi:hypothetical protein